MTNDKLLSSSSFVCRRRNHKLNDSARARRSRNRLCRSGILPVGKTARTKGQASRSGGTAPYFWGAQLPLVATARLGVSRIIRGRIHADQRAPESSAGADATGNAGGGWFTGR
jgi:hypothetical protein